jgi:amino acid transporter
MQGSTAGFTARAIIICTVLYIVVALVLTGMVNYSELNVGDPLAFVFHKLDLKWMSSIVAVSAVIAMASVLLFSKWVNRVYG